MACCALLALTECGAKKVRPALPICLRLREAVAEEMLPKVRAFGAYSGVMAKHPRRVCIRMGEHGDARSGSPEGRCWPPAERRCGCS